MISRHFFARSMYILLLTLPVIGQTPLPPELEDAKLRAEYAQAHIPTATPIPRPSHRPVAAEKTALPHDLELILSNPDLLSLLPTEYRQVLKSPQYHAALRTQDEDAVIILDEAIRLLQEKIASPSSQPSRLPVPKGPPVHPQVQQIAQHLQNPQIQALLSAQPHTAKHILKGLDKALKKASVPAEQTGLWSRIKSLRTALSPSSLTSKFTGAVGLMVVKGWKRTWKLIGQALAGVVGKSNVYELDAKGNIQYDEQGRPLPKMVMRTRTLLDLDRTMSGQGLMQLMPTLTTGGTPAVFWQEKGPNRWYEIIHNEHQLFTTLVEAGLMRVSRTIMGSIDRLIVRPLLSEHLHMPESKLSYPLYLLHMHTKMEDDASLLDPTKLGIQLLPIVLQPELLVDHRLPFDLNAIRKAKGSKDDPVHSEQTIMLIKEIRMFMHQLFSPLINVMSSGGSATWERTGDDRLAHEAKELGLEFMDGMRNNQSFTAHAVLGIGRMATRKLKSATGQSPDLDETAADQLDRDLADIEQAVNQIYLRPDNAHGPINVSFRGRDLSLSPDLQRALLWTTERSIEMFRDGIIPSIQAKSGLMSYPQFMRRLLLPRFAMKFMPEAVKQKLGINTPEEAAQKIELVNEYFDVAFYGLDAIIDLIAFVQQYRNTSSIRGQYHTFAGSLHAVLCKVSMALRSMGITDDPDLVDHSVKYLINQLSSGKFGSRFSPREQRRISQALLLAGIFDKDRIKELTKTGSVDEIVRKISEGIKRQEAAHAEFFGEGTHTPNGLQRLRDSRWGNILISFHSGLRILLDAYENYGIGDILEELDQKKKTLGEVGPAELMKMFARKSTAHFVATGVETIVGKLFKPLTQAIVGIGSTVLGAENYQMLQQQFHAKTGGALVGGLTKPIYTFTKHFADEAMRRGVGGTLDNFGEVMGTAGSKTARSMPGLDKLKSMASLEGLMGAAGGMGQDAMMQMMQQSMGGFVRGM